MLVAQVSRVAQSRPLGQNGRAGVARFDMILKKIEA